MNTINVNFNKTTGTIKPMHAVNNGPVGDDIGEQIKTKVETYRAAKIPYARNHDASFWSDYGGEHTVDVHAIFPDFNKNPYNPDSYDFIPTDDYLKSINDVGTEVFYRLGTKIEHGRRKYGSIVPADFKKWAVIVEHIIRHYTEGWANGFNYKITYWEIWNEPDGKTAKGDQPNWSGTAEEFYEFYEVVATHLKKRFPHLEIGGPSMSGLNVDWLENFLTHLTEDGKRITLDFFSWHSYYYDPYTVTERSKRAREILDKYGYTETKMFLNEWNYLENWTDKFVSSIEGIIGMRGAAYTSAFMALGQKSEVDMLMYYDARPGSSFNGMFDFYTLRPLKGYYPFVMFSKLYELKNEAESQSDDKELFVAAAGNDDEKAIMITYFSTDKEAPGKDITVNIQGGADGEWVCARLDAEHTMDEEILEVKNGTAKISIPHESVLLISKR